MEHLKGIDWEWANHEEDSLICQTCGVYFNSLATHAVHEPCVFQSPFYQPAVHRFFQCTSCPYNCWSAEKLCIHLYTRHREKSYKCNHCGHMTNYKKEMFTHVYESHHMGRCLIQSLSEPCQMVFKSKVDMMAHVTEGHGLQVSPCDACGELKIQDELYSSLHQESCKQSDPQQEQQPSTS